MNKTFLFYILLIICLTSCKTSVLVPDKIYTKDKEYRIKKLVIKQLKDEASLPIPEKQKVSNTVTIDFQFKYDISNNLTQITKKSSDLIFGNFLSEKIDFSYNSKNQLIQKITSQTSNVANLLHYEKDVIMNLVWDGEKINKIDNTTILNEKNNNIGLIIPCDGINNFTSSLSLNLSNLVSNLDFNGEKCPLGFDSAIIKTLTYNNEFDGTNLISNVTNAIIHRKLDKIEVNTYASKENFSYGKIKNPFSLLPANAYPLKNWYFNTNYFPFPYPFTFFEDLSSFNYTFLQLYSNGNGNLTSSGNREIKREFFSANQYLQRQRTYSMNSPNFTENRDINILKEFGDYPLSMEEKFNINGVKQSTLIYDFEYEEIL